MTDRAAKKIVRGLLEALALATGSAEPAKATMFMECHDCGNLVRVDVRCPECGAKLYRSVNT